MIIGNIEKACIHNILVCLGEGSCYWWLNRQATHFVFAAKAVTQGPITIAIFAPGFLHFLFALSNRIICMIIYVPTSRHVAGLYNMVSMHLPSVCVPGSVWCLPVFFLPQRLSVITMHFALTSNLECAVDYSVFWIHTWSKAVCVHDLTSTSQPASLQLAAGWLPDKRGTYRTLARLLRAGWLTGKRGRYIEARLDCCGGLAQTVINMTSRIW